MDFKSSEKLFLLLLSLSSLSMCQAGNIRQGESLYRIYYFDDICPGDNEKKEIEIKGGAAVFKFDELNLKTRRLLQERDLMCHIELETQKDHGFHVYIDEMMLDDDDDIDCGDYLQFGRDVFFFTTRRSKKYCGVRSKIDYSRNMSMTHLQSQLAIRGDPPPSSSRLHVEEDDKEMDVWLKVRKSDPRKRVRRHLSIVVTIFKKWCKDNNPFYMRCARTNQCIRRELLCDGYVNCAPPFGHVAVDEVDCDNFIRPWEADQLSSSMADSSEHSAEWRYNRLLIVAVVAVVVICVLVVCGIVCKRIYAANHRKRHSCTPLLPETMSPLATGSVAAAIPAASTETETLMSNPPQHFSIDGSSPPSYEDAIKHSNNSRLTHAFVTDPPPSYAAFASAAAGEYGASAPPYEEESDCR